MQNEKYYSFVKFLLQFCNIFKIMFLHNFILLYYTTKPLSFQCFLNFFALFFVIFSLHFFCNIFVTR